MRPDPCSARGEPQDVLDVHIPGWREIQHGHDMEVWQDLDGDFLGLVRTHAALGLPQLCDEVAVRRHCQAFAETMESGLVEAEVVPHVDGPAVELICKHLKMLGFVFTGMLMVPTPRATWIWTMSAEEQGLARLWDEECYDREFPDHPLSRVRRELRKLLAVGLDG
jgi:hypothetical protein